ncbi:MAG: efflux RND transporter permease subunit [Halieaceae bacterium]|nr:MAG: efflux RND transporter permease subunit [Halieaceae bacterium]
MAESDIPIKRGLPELGVRRPWLVLVLNLLIAIGGIAALLAIEVRELPDVDRPVVSVNAFLPGASPETMDSEVTRLLEGAAARVSGVMNINSSSEENSTRIWIEFRPEIDTDQAASDVREAISRIERDLPDALEQLSVYKADERAGEIMRIAVRSSIHTDEELNRFVEQDIVPRIVSLPGVADASLLGSRQRVLRIILDPLRLTSYGLTVADVATVLRAAPLDVPAGSFRAGDQQLLVRADAAVTSEADIASLIIRDEIRVGQVAKVAFSPEDATSFVRLNGERIVGISVIRQAGSNTVRIADGVRAAVADINTRIEGVDLRISSDDSVFIRGSVREVVTTLLISILVVIGTIRLFTGSMRLTLIPAIAIPISLLGTLAASWALGFSINILTLLALVLAAGLIVDDAIVVLESVQRQRAQGTGPSAAAVVGTRKVFFAVIATTAVLIAVFVPIAFLPGTAGRLFQEFGLVLAVAVAISSFVALSLVPAVMARLPASAPRQRRVSDWGNRLAQSYHASLQTVLNAPRRTASICLLAAASAAGLYTLLDQELLPAEDRGTIYLFGKGPDGVGLNYTERQADRMESMLLPLMESGEIIALFTVVGRWDPNNVFMLAKLADWRQRERSQQEIAADLKPLFADLPGVATRIFSANSLNLRGASSGGLSVALLGTDYDEIYAAAREYTEQIRSRLDSVSRPRIGYDPSQPQLSVGIDRERASDLNISLEDVAQTLRVMVDGARIVDLNADDQTVPIILEAGSDKIRDPSDLVNLYVRTRSGALVPLSSIVRLDERGVASQLDRREQRRAIEIDVEIQPGFAMQTAVDDLFELADEVLPDSVTLITRGEAAALAETNRETLITYGFALLIVFLVLVAQFEGVTSALVIMAIVPFGLAAAICALFLTGTSLNIYSQVGLVMLIGLIAKNGILLVEFADQLRDQGFAVREAIEEAARIRLRPIVMTLVSTVLGALPLILASGPGSEARSAVGWVVFGGMGLATFFTLYLTPVAYLGIARFAKARAASGERLRQELAQE